MFVILHAAGARARRAVPTRHLLECGEIVARRRREIAGLAALTVGLTALGSAADTLTHPALGLVLAVATEGACAAATLLGLLAAWWTRDRRVGATSAAVGGYGLLAVPTSTVDALDAPVARSAVCLLLLGLMALALTAPSWSRRRAGVVLLGVGSVLAAAGVVDLTFPTAVAPVVTSLPWRLAVAAAWVLLATALAHDTLRRPSWNLGLVSSGIAVLGAAHLESAALAAPWRDGSAPLFTSLRLIGVALVLHGTIALARAALRDLERQRTRREEELRLAELRLVRSIERDHEVRNGLAGLAGAATLWRGADDPRLHGVVVAELHRLDALLRPVDRSAPVPFAVLPVVEGLAVLRREAGLDVRVTASPDLTAVGAPATLAQVVTNLIANAERHAPGSPVRIDARREGDRVVVRVRDFGPGIASDHAPAVLDAGVRDERAGGQGLGLAVARRLLEAESGSIRVLRPGDGEPGCLVTVDLPATATAPAPAAPTPTPAR